VYIIAHCSSLNTTTFFSLYVCPVPDPTRISPQRLSMFQPRHTQLLRGHRNCNWVHLGRIDYHHKLSPASDFFHISTLTSHRMSHQGVQIWFGERRFLVQGPSSRSPKPQLARTPLLDKRSRGEDVVKQILEEEVVKRNLAEDTSPSHYARSAQPLLQPLNPISGQIDVQGDRLLRRKENSSWSSCQGLRSQFRRCGVSTSRSLSRLGVSKSA
jgi:hypothetical protein